MEYFKMKIVSNYFEKAVFISIKLRNIISEMFPHNFAFNQQKFSIITILHYNTSQYITGWIRGMNLKDCRLLHTLGTLLLAPLQRLIVLYALQLYKVTINFHSWFPDIRSHFIVPQFQSSRSRFSNKIQLILFGCNVNNFQ